MSIAWTRIIDQHIAAPHPRRATGDEGLRRPPSPPPRFLSSRGAISPGTALAAPVTRSPRGSRWSSGWDVLPNAASHPVPSMRAPYLDALAAVVASTRGVLAAQAHVAAHKAARSPNP